MANLAAHTGIKVRWKEAEELQVVVMETRKQVLGTEHPDTLKAMADLASTYEMQGQWKNALLLLFCIPYQFGCASTCSRSCHHMYG